MRSNLGLTSFTDLQTYTLPTEAYIGSLRTDADFIEIARLSDVPRCVKLCRDKKNRNTEVALKYIDQEGDSPCLSTTTFREITILRSLDHKNVIKLHEVLVVPEFLNRLCLVLEYCPYSVLRYIKDYPRDIIPHDQIKNLAKQLFTGLRYLHKNHIMHRDIKPENLLLDKDGTLKIIDFDISRRYNNRGRITTPNMVTLYYRAPEILLEAPSYDCKIDMWAAGCVLGELFTKEPILMGHSDLNQIKLIVELIGIPDEKEWPGFKECRVVKNFDLGNQRYNKIGERLQQRSCADGIKLLQGLLKYNPSNRLSADDCLEHNWLEKAPFPAGRIEIPRAIFEENKLNALDR